MTDPRSGRAGTRLRNHLILTAGVLLALAWVFRRSAALKYVLGVGLVYGAGLGALLAWAWRRPEAALGADEGPKGGVGQAVPRLILAIGVAVLFIAFWGLDEWDMSTVANAADLAAAFRKRFVVGGALTLGACALIFMGFRRRARSLELFAASARGLTLAVVGLGFMGAMMKSATVIASVDLAPPEVVGLGGWVASPPRIQSAREYVSEDGTEVLSVIRTSTRANVGCEKAPSPGDALPRASVELRQPLADLPGLACRTGARLRSDVLEEVEVGFRRCPSGDYSYFYRWIAHREIPEEALASHLSCPPVAGAAR